MLEQLIYKNHINEVFEFGKNGIFVNTSDLHDYDWSVTKNGNKISALSRQVSTRKLPLIILCKTEQEGIAARNRLLEVVEKDVLAMKHGQVIVGDYYFKCFVTKSAKKDYLQTDRFIRIDLTLSSDRPYWVKERVTPFRTDVGGDGTGIGLDYPHDFPFDYFSTMASTQLVNDGFVASNFKIIIYGACSDPSISINDHVYQVECDVLENEYLTIDSAQKKIYVTTNNGTIVNKFNDRNKASYIFEKIAAGTNIVTWTGAFGFDVILMEERSEPKWT